MTKTMLNQEWAMGIDEMIEAEAQAQAICMQTGDFERAFEAFAAKQTPTVRGQLMRPRLPARRSPLPFFDAGHAPIARGSRSTRTRGREAAHLRGLTARTRKTPTPPVAAWCAALGEARAFLRYTASRRHTAARRRRWTRVLALRVLRETLAYPRRPGGFRVRDAGPRQRRRSRWAAAMRCSARVAAFKVARGEWRWRRSRCPSRMPGRMSARCRPRRRRDGDGWVLDGEKTWISNGGIADVYTVFARTGDDPARAASAPSWSPADTPGLDDRRAAST
jgi:hypothetical protein